MRLRYHRWKYMRSEKRYEKCPCGTHYWEMFFAWAEMMHYFWLKEDPQRGDKWRSMMSALLRQYQDSQPPRETMAWIFARTKELIRESAAEKNVTL